MGEPIRVLHVDDDPGFVDIAAECLEAEHGDVEVVTETSAAAALDRFRDADVDCVVSDYHLTETDGLELLDRIRDVDPDVPFVLFTAQGSEEIASEAISKGVTDYLQKGGGRETYAILGQRIRNAVEGVRAEKRAARSRRFLEKIVDRAYEVISVMDAEGEVTFVSGSVERILGYESAEIEELGFELVHPEDRDLLEEMFRDRVENPDRVTGVTYRAIHRDGHTVKLQSRAYNLLDDPDVEGIVIYSRPVEE